MKERYKFHRLDGSVEHRRLAEPRETVFMQARLIFMRTPTPEGFEYVEVRDERHAMALLELQRRGVAAAKTGAW